MKLDKASQVNWSNVCNTPAILKVFNSSLKIFIIRESYLKNINAQVSVVLSRSRHISDGFSQACFLAFTRDPWLCVP